MEFTKSSLSSDVLLILSVCVKTWLVIFLPGTFVISFWSYPSIHLISVIALIFLVTVFKLPTPDKDLVRKVLGDEEMDLQTRSLPTKGGDYSSLSKGNNSK